MKNIFLLLALFYSLATQAQPDNPPIYVNVTGAGKPILLIPGFTVPGEIWDATVHQLKENYECHVVTLAGFGGKQPIAFPWLPKVNKALEDYMSDRKLTDLTIIGHSLGGTVAAWLAARDHNEISKIILVDALPATGALMMPDFNPDAFVYESPYNDQVLAMNETEFSQMATNMSTGMSLNPEAQSRIKDWLIMADRETYVYGYTDYLKLDVRADLKNIDSAVIILAADEPYGKEAVTQNYKSQYANLANNELIIATHSAHFIMLDQPEWFMKQIQQILLDQ